MRERDNKLLIITKNDSTKKWGEKNEEKLISNQWLVPGKMGTKCERSATHHHSVSCVLHTHTDTLP